MAFSIGDYMGWGANPVYQGLASNRNALMQFGAGLASGNGWEEGFANGLQGLSRGALADDAYALMEEEKAKEQETLNQTTEWLRQNGHANLLAAVESGAMSPGAAWEAALAPPPSGPEPTSAVQNYQFLLSKGVDGKTAMERAFGGGGTSINNYGSIPQGYELFQDPSTGTTRMQPIPGGPAALEAEAAAAAAANNANNDQTLTETVVNAADLARQAFASGGLTGGTLGNVLANVPESQAAEVRRQVKVLAGNAVVSNLQAMREASPTGGALGSVTEGELQLLMSLQGALDPASPNFIRDLDNFERQFLKTVHGNEAGTRIFNETRKNSGAGGSVDDILKQYGVP